MRYCRRDFICKCLKLALSTSYAIVGSAYGHLISSDEVLTLLNRSRNLTQPVLTDLPGDLLTPDEAAAIPEIAESGITAHDIVNWTKRKRNPAPCFRFNSHTRRIRRTDFLAWMDATSRIRRRG